MALSYIEVNVRYGKRAFMTLGTLRCQPIEVINFYPFFVIVFFFPHFSYTHGILKTGTISALCFTRSFLMNFLCIWTTSAKHRKCVGF